MSVLRKPDPAKTCAVCGAPMARKVINGRLEDRGVFLRRKTCGRACMAVGYEGTIKVLNPYNSRKQSAKTNTGTCNRCGRPVSETRLYVHHKDENPLNNVLENLETLCGSCYRKAHAPLPKECQCCERPARHRGLCNTHYSRFRRHGDPGLIVTWKDGQRQVVRVSEPG